MKRREFIKIAGGAAAGARTVQTTPQLTVDAGMFDRRETIVSFDFAAGVRGKTYSLRDEAGKAIPLQVDGDGRAAFLLAELKAGRRTTYRVEESSIPSGGKEVRITPQGNLLNVVAAGRPVLSYRTRGELPSADIKPIFLRGGYIHPVYTPSGRIITDDYPRDHPHHHGVWFAWTKTEFEGRHPDFWNMGDGTGTIEFIAVDGTWSGPVHAGLKARHRYIDLSGSGRKTALNEVWEVMAYPVSGGPKPHCFFDVISTQECASSSPLVLPEYHYGGIGIRGHAQWNGKGNKTIFLTAEGKDRDTGHGTRGRWCHVGGEIDGQFAGIAILDHPGNFRSPQPMRLNPDNPFFCYAPSQMGQWTISPGQKYVSRYRFVVYDGAPDPAELNRLWNDYANPPKVR